MPNADNNPATFQADGDGRYRISGVLSFASVPELARTSREWFDGRSNIVVDLDAIERSDSAGVALLVEWVRSAGDTNVSIEFINAPDQIYSIVALSGLEALLPLQGPNEPN